MKNKNKIKNILLKILSFSFSFTLKEKIQQIEQKMNRKKCRYILMLYVIIPLACYSTAHCVYNLCILCTIGLKNVTIITVVSRTQFLSVVYFFWMFKRTNN